MLSPLSHLSHLRTRNRSIYDRKTTTFLSPSLFHSFSFTHMHAHTYTLDAPRRNSRRLRVGALVRIKVGGVAVWRLRRASSGPCSGNRIKECERLLQRAWKLHPGFAVSLLLHFLLLSSSRERESRERVRGGSFFPCPVETLLRRPRANCNKHPRHVRARVRSSTGSESPEERR